MTYITEKRSTRICGEYDVIVVGGGIAGIAAMLAAVRNGAKTLLIEKMTVLGGLATAGHVVIYLPLCDGMGRKLIGGIPEELLYASIKNGYNSLPEEWMGGRERVETKKRYKTVFNGPAFMLALDELALKSGADVLFDTVFCDVIQENGLCQAIIVENKSGRQAYRCKAVVDASGDADVLYRAGADCEEHDNFLTYWTYCLSEANKDILMNASCIERGIKLMALGNCEGTDLPKGTKKYYGTNAQEITEFLFECRKRAREKIENDKNVTFTSFPSMAQFRTTRHLNGEYILTSQDEGKHFTDSIGCTGDWRKPGPVFEIPFRSLYSKKIQNIFAAGRIISSSGDAWEVTRVIPPAAVTGQAAGTAAALFVQDNMKVSIDLLQSILKRDGALLKTN